MLTNQSVSYHACFLSLNPNVLSSISAAIDAQLERTLTVKVSRISSLSELSSRHWDLVIVDAQILNETEIPSWIEGLYGKLIGTSTIWIPALIFSTCSPATTIKICEQMVALNWYFDIVHPDHVSSIPLRIANLIRIHNHLRELLEYKSILDDLQQRVDAVESQSRKIGSKDSTND